LATISAVVTGGMGSLDAFSEIRAKARISEHVGARSRPGKCDTSGAAARPEHLCYGSGGMSLARRTTPSRAFADARFTVTGGSARREALRDPVGAG